MKRLVLASLAFAICNCHCLAQIPTIQVQPQSQIVQLASSDTITVVTTNVPTPIFQWRFNQTNLTDTARITGSHSNTLAFSNMLLSDTGNYDVILSNASGSVTSVVASVKVSNAGTPPTNVAPFVIWAREGGGPVPTAGNWNERVTKLAGDGRGGVYAAGAFSQFARFGSLEFNSAGPSEEFFLVKYDAAGIPVWEKHGSSTGGTSITGLASTADGGVVAVVSGYAPATIGGQFVDVATNTTFVENSPQGVPWFTFVVKFDALGNRIWSRVIHGYGGSLGVNVDPFGSVTLFVAGNNNHYHAAVIDIDGQVFQGSQEGTVITWFLVKFDSSGQFQSAKEINSYDWSSYGVDLYGSDVDAEGNLYLTGRCTARAGMGNYTYTWTIGSISLSVTDPLDRGADVWFAAKLDTDGNGLWITNLGSGSHPGWDIKVDAAGETYLAGAIGDVAESNKLVKLDAYGQILWTKFSVWGSMTGDPAGNIFLVGYYYPKSYFEEIVGHPVNDPYGANVGVGMLGYSPSGQLRFSRYISANGTVPIPYTLVQDAPGSWFLGGRFDVSATIGDGFELRTPWPGRDTESFVARLAIPATNELPWITVQPQDTTVFETRPLQLNVQATSLSLLTYLWKSNGIPVPNGTGNILAFTNAGLNLSGTYSVSVSNANGGAESTSAIVIVLPLTKLAETLNATNLQWGLGGRRSWQLDTNVTHDGVVSLRTDYLLQGANPVEDCWIEATIQGPGVLSFWWKASTGEHNIYCGCDDGFQFQLDGVKQFEILGDVDWQPRSLPISAGTHTARWYWSEPNVPGNLNLCWVDQVSFQTLADAAPSITGTTILPGGKFQFTINSSPGAKLSIEACSDLKSWLPIGQLVATNGVATFTHNGAVNFQQHYYRVVQINL